MKNIVVAYDRDNAIGREGELPWAGQLPADMKRFRELTTNDTVIMGRKTFESLPDNYRPLPNRQNIVLTMGSLAANGFEVAHSLDEAYSLARNEEIHIIGGGQIYAAAIDTVDRIYATEIDTVVENADAYFPLISQDEWVSSEQQIFAADEKNKFGYSFLTYLRSHPIQ